MSSIAARVVPLLLALALAACGPNVPAGKPPAASSVPAFRFVVTNTYHGPYPGTPHEIPVLVYSDALAVVATASVLEGGSVTFDLPSHPTWIGLQHAWWGQHYVSGVEYDRNGARDDAFSVSFP